ncbi:uncharacterized protein SOCEGT47_039860 [Sorangium cellulosum]|uniref:Uncharacterized protein n=1 Tax=Sorangium cellulosum TaxID=56 RepID=A0A4P2Q2W0_SORCE|nr:hypothetical protein [Sorangium cellulosum]AUX23461.1 uncharacterized protein SOCEGT47_039860 [Sorangium cellulosum]
MNPNVAAPRDASRAPNELAAEVMTLSAELQALAASFEEAIAPHKDLLATHGAPMPDLTSGALRSLSAMLGYEMRPLCEAASSSWREAGCDVLRGRFDAAEAELRTSLPRKVAAGLASLREMGMEAALLDAAQARLDAGDVKGAAIAHDAAVRGAEGT